MTKTSTQEKLRRVVRRAAKKHALREVWKNATRQEACACGCKLDGAWLDHFVDELLAEILLPTREKELVDAELQEAKRLLEAWNLWLASMTVLPPEHLIDGTSTFLSRPAGSEKEG